MSMERSGEYVSSLSDANEEINVKSSKCNEAGNSENDVGNIIKNSEESDSNKEPDKGNKTTESMSKDDVRRKKREKRMRFQPKNVLDSDENINYYEEFLNKGDDIDLPRELIAMEYATGHAEELQSMLNALKQHSGNKTPMQTLPFRLRRRAAASHNKRLPRRLRELAKKLGGENEKKTIVRRKRRRNINLQNEYAKRAGKQGWLETHLWHAKRFRMSSDEGQFANFGNRVALTSYEKCFRASYRAVAKHCAIQDLSFFKFIEVSGNEEVLVDLLKFFLPKFEIHRLENLTENLSEIEVLVYDKLTTPPQCVGPVNVMFLPAAADADERRLWLWLHPTLLRKIMSMLEYYAEKHDIGISDISSSLNRFRLTGPTSSVILLSVLRSYKLIDNGDEKSKLGLTEHFFYPQLDFHNDFSAVHKTVLNSWTSASFLVFNCTQMQLEEDIEEKPGIQSWLRKNKELVERQHSMFVAAMKKCHLEAFPSEDAAPGRPCDPEYVYSLIVNDPRLTLPRQKEKVDFKSSVEATKYENVDDLIREGDSPLWNISYRNEVSTSRPPDHIVSTRKCEAKFQWDEEKENTIKSLALPVPVALIRRGGHTDDKSSPSSPRTVHGGPPNHFGSGWDIIVPPNWAMAFWIPFIYHHAKPVGLKNYFHSRLERKVSSFPRDYPDTEAGADWWKWERKSNHTNYFKKPPSKRNNYSVLGTRYPFAPEWRHVCLNLEKSPNLKPTFDCQPVIGDNVLVSHDLKAEDENLKRTLDSDIDEEPVAKKFKLDEEIEDPVILPQVLRDTKLLHELNRLIACDDNDALDQFEKLAANHADELVTVRLTPLSKGVPAAQTTICLPTSEDIDQLKSHFDDLNSKGLPDCWAPVEPKHWDPYRKERKEATKLAKKNRKRKKEKKVPIERNYPCSFNVTPSRELLGFVTSGDFLFSFATGGGIGFVNIQALTRLLRTRMENVWLKLFLNETAHSSGLLCLMKNIDTSQYRFATIDISLTND